MAYKPCMMWSIVTFMGLVSITCSLSPGQKCMLFSAARRSLCFLYLLLSLGLPPLHIHKSALQYLFLTLFTVACNPNIFS